MVNDLNEAIASGDVAYTDFTFVEVNGRWHCPVIGCLCSFVNEDKFIDDGAAIIAHVVEHVRKGEYVATQEAESQFGIN